MCTVPEVKALVMLRTCVAACEHWLVKFSISIKYLMSWLISLLHIKSRYGIYLKLITTQLMNFGTTRACVNSLSLNMHGQLPSRARCLNCDLNLYLHLFYLNASSKDSGEIVRMRINV